MLKKAITIVNSNTSIVIITFHLVVYATLCHNYNAWDYGASVLHTMLVDFHNREQCDAGIVNTMS